MAVKSDKDNKSSSMKKPLATNADAKPSTKSKKALEDDDDNLDDDDALDTKSSSKKTTVKSSAKKSKDDDDDEDDDTEDVDDDWKNLKKMTIGIPTLMNLIFLKARVKKQRQVLRKKPMKRMILKSTKTLKSSTYSTINLVDLTMMKMKTTFNQPKLVKHNTAAYPL